MSDQSLHVQAKRGYTYTGTAVDLDGEECSNICREAKDVWQGLGMINMINSAVAEVEEQYKACII